MGYNIGDIINIPNYGVVKVIGAVAVLPCSWHKGFWRYHLEMITDKKGYEVYNCVKFRTRCIIEELPILKVAPIPKRNWLKDKKGNKLKELAMTKEANKKEQQRLYDIQRLKEIVKEHGATK